MQAPSTFDRGTRPVKNLPESNSLAGKVLVTGGAGFIGSHLVDRLAADGLEVVVLDNLSRGKVENLANCRPSIHLIKADIRDRRAVEEAMKGVSCVFHLAAQSSVLGAERDPDHVFEANVVGTYEVLRAASSNGVKCVVFSSSREVYGDPLVLPVAETAPIAPKNAYGASKAAGEIYCRAFAQKGLEVAVLRLANVYGPRDYGRVIPLFIEQAMNNKQLTVFGGQKILDFLWIDDLIHVLVEAARRRCIDTPVNVGSGRGTTLSELATRISILTGNKVNVTEGETNSSEVNHFIADISAAKVHFELNCPQDALAHLPPMMMECVSAPPSTPGRIRTENWPLEERRKAIGAHH